MIRVLRNWEEVGEAVMSLQREGLPLHETPQKNFDHFLLRESVASVDRRARLVDLGCGSAFTLRFLHALGFSNLCGVDLVVDKRARARQALLMLREHTLRPPFRLCRGDLTTTPLSPASCDAVLSISTIEHGVDLERFLAESARILRIGGPLFLSTDYLQAKI